MMLSISIPDDIKDRAITAICANHQYDADATGLTPAQFAKQQLIEWLKCEIQAYEIYQIETVNRQTLNDLKSSKISEVAGLGIV